MSDTEARDLLAQIINEYMEADVPETVADKHEPVDADYAMADAILAAGWLPPARTVTTVEQLDALPVGSIVRDDERAALDEKWDDNLWAEVGYEYTFSSISIHTPVTVLWEPEEDQ